MFFCELLNAAQALRDPFHLPNRSARKKGNDSIKLLGIIRSRAGGFNANSSNSGKFGAVLELDGQTETVFVKDDFFGFKVLSIKAKSVLLANGKQKKKLFIE